MARRNPRRPTSRTTHRQTASTARRITPTRSTPVRRSVNTRRVQQNAIKRTAVANKINRQRPGTVRPQVRPSTPPRRVMPRTPTQARVGAVQARPARRQVARPSDRPRPSTPTRARPSTNPNMPRKVTSARNVVHQGSPAIRNIAAAGAAAAATAFVLNTSRAHPNLAPSVLSLDHSLTDLQSRSDLSHVVEDVERLEKNLTHAIDLLESAREKGFVYQNDLDDLATNALALWESVRDQVYGAIDTQANTFQTQLNPLGSEIQRLNGRISSASSATAVQTTQSKVNQLLNDLSTIERDIQSDYQDVESKVSTLNYRLTRVHWALSQLEEAKFALNEDEKLVMATKGRWDQRGDDDPEGILFLSNKRLIFERKETVATKKVLFIATSKELVQEVQIDETISSLGSVKAVSKGLFGHQDFLEVTFAKVGTVSFHLDGQDSENWATLIEMVRTGKIENERSTGSAISFSTISGELTSADLVNIQNEINELQDELMLSELRSELEDLETELGVVERQLNELRNRSYVIEKNLEGDIQLLKAQWDRVRTNTETVLNQQAALLTTQSSAIQQKMARLAGMSGDLKGARPIYMQLKSNIASAEAQAEAAEQTVLDQFDEFAEEVEGLSAHLSWVEWMLDAIATASFQLMATESGVAAVEATYGLSGVPENGILFLTDQRLLWEDRVGDYELKVEVPLSQVIDVKKELGEDDDGADEFLTFSFDSNAPLSTAKVDLATFVADDWIKMVGRARSGEYASNRAVEIDEAEIEKVKNAPTKCPNCSASFTSPVLRGQTEINCEWCGAVTRL